MLSPDELCFEPVTYTYYEQLNRYEFLKSLEIGDFFYTDGYLKADTQLRMGKIVRERYPELTEADQEAVRQQAVAALNFTQRAKQLATGGEAGNMALIQGVRKFAMDVRDLDIDLIDSINPFEAAYAVLAKAMDEKTLRQVQASIAGKRVNIPYEEARELALRALQFKRERGRVPDITSQDGWEKHMAEGVVALARYRPGPLFSGRWNEEDIESGTIYVLRSLSTHPFVAAHRQLIHKIGVTGEA